MIEPALRLRVARGHPGANKASSSDDINSTLWASGSEPAAIVRCLSGMIGLVYALYIYMNRRSVATFARAV